MNLKNYKRAGDITKKIERIDILLSYTDASVWLGKGNYKFEDLSPEFEQVILRNIHCTLKMKKQKLIKELEEL